MAGLEDQLIDPVAGARALLGCTLATRDGLRCRIVEAEAYGGADDPGSHAYRGPTPRCLTMFGPPGRAYIYLSYGCHWMLNVSCCPEGTGSAVLIRAALPIDGLDLMRSRRPKAGGDRGLLRGPGRLAQALGLDREHDGSDLLDPADSFLWLEPAAEPPVDVLATRRIGLAPGKGDLTRWRFVDKQLEWWASPHPRLIAEPGAKK